MNLKQKTFCDSEKYSLTMYFDDIMCLKIKEGIELNLEETKGIVEAGLELAGHKKFKVITDFRVTNNSNKVFSDEAKIFVGKDEYFNSFKICDAFILNSFLHSIIAGVYIKFTQPLTPTRVFSNFDEALEWVVNFN